MSNEQLKQLYKEASAVWYSQDKMDTRFKYLKWDVMQHTIKVYSMKNNVSLEEAREYLEC
jgi:hypothetical protein